MHRSTQWRRANAQRINAQRRLRYLETREADNERRRRVYAEISEALLAKARADRALCPICNKDLRRLYIKTHIQTKHADQCILDSKYDPNPIIDPTVAPVKTPTGPPSEPISAPSAIAAPTPAAPAAAPPAVSPKPRLKSSEAPK